MRYEHRDRDSVYLWYDGMDYNTALQHFKKGKLGEFRSEVGLSVFGDLPEVAGNNPDGYYSKEGGGIYLRVHTSQLTQKVRRFT